MRSPEIEIAASLPPPGCPVAEAEHYTRWLATHHYENFHVVSWMLPRDLRRHFYNVYAYCRWADDLGDEVGDAAHALELLDWWGNELTLCYEGQPCHPVFVALAQTIREFDIPAQPFRDLLTAFRQDQTVHHYDTWEGLLSYCRYSANPVGRLVLYLCGYRDAERQRLSDATCTALQLANFWQDVSRDLEKGRIYIPVDALQRHGLEVKDIEGRVFDQHYAALMRELIARTRELFAQGWPLAASVDWRLSVDIELFSRGGMAVLDAIESMGYNTLVKRPAISGPQRLVLLGRTLASRILPERGARKSLETVMSDTGAASTGVREKNSRAIDRSYERCRSVARNAASNFYYAFYMLPRPKRDALCAIYAFMRLVDDISDSPGGSATQPSEYALKRAGLSRWRVLLDECVAGNTSGHAILPAFADAIKRYRIPSRYFHDLISGAEMDLLETRYATFGALQEYCYRVAGTVGLTCLHVFGFQDPHATELAEHLGIAFQLTNILRDVRPDLALGRVYIPAEDFARFGCGMAELERGVVTPSVRELLRFEAERAWRFYREGTRLIGKVDADSKAALWALVRIYSSLLARIEERDFDVFSARVRLSAPEKAGILLRARVGWWSEADVLEERDRDRRRPGGTVLGRRAS
ncbi:MAG: squalene synthase HpnC [Acidobacteria bacterium]|nr:MAG: squalene synthase HpnC [Acidobacteriota bacterium]